MPYALKPRFEQHRHECIKAGKPMRESDIVPRQAALVDGLSKLPDVLIEKVRRLPREDGMLEISAKWLGLDSDQRATVSYLKKHFPEATLGLENLLYWVGPSEEVVLLAFAGTTEDRYLTGKVLITF